MYIPKYDIIVFKPLQCGICGVELRSQDRYEAHYDACRAQLDDDRERLRLFRLNGPAERAEASSMGIEEIRKHLSKIPKKRG